MQLRVASLTMTNHDIISHVVKARVAIEELEISCSGLLGGYK